MRRLRRCNTAPLSQPSAQYRRTGVDYLPDRLGIGLHLLFWCKMQVIRGIVLDGGGSGSEERPQAIRAHSQPASPSSPRRGWDAVQSGTRICTTSWRRRKNSSEGISLEAGCRGSWRMRMTMCLTDWLLCVGRKRVKTSATQMMTVPQPRRTPRPRRETLEAMKHARLPRPEAPTDIRLPPEQRPRLGRPLHRRVLLSGFWDLREDPTQSRRRASRLDAGHLDRAARARTPVGIPDAGAGRANSYAWMLPRALGRARSARRVLPDCSPDEEYPAGGDVALGRGAGLRAPPRTESGPRVWPLFPAGALRTRSPNPRSDWPAGACPATPNARRTSER